MFPGMLSCADVVFICGDAAAATTYFVILIQQGSDRPYPTPVPTHSLVLGGSVLVTDEK